MHCFLAIFNTFQMLSDAMYSRLTARALLFSSINYSYCRGIFNKALMMILVVNLLCAEIFTSV